jgi:hypothetical protein
MYSVAAECGKRLIDAKDMNGHSALSWASWYSRPIPILGKLCYGDFRVHPKHTGVKAHLRASRILDAPMSAKLKRA